MIQLLCILAISSQAANYVWWEAETPVRTNFPAAEQNPFAPADAQQADALSGGKWVGLEGKRDETKFLEYEVDVPSAGEYQLYARKFWKHGPYRWRADDGPWQNIGSEVALMDDSPLRQHLVANWTYAGSANLTKGRHTIRVELTTNDGAAAFDAFVLTKSSFVARGKLKPGEKYGRTTPGFFAFEPDPDPFRASAIDLSYLNEKFAGEGGHLVAKADKLIHSKTGKSVRFWAVNTGNDTLGLDKPSLRNLARSWAKSGVNMVRVHGKPWGPDFKTLREGYLDSLQFFVDAMKKEGIYTCLSIYFPLWMNPPYDGSPFQGYNGRNPFDLLFYNPEFQSIYRGWWKQILTAKSPYSGMTLAEDPAMAILEMVNEESHFFWTFVPYNNQPEQQMPEFERQFGAWLAKKYGSAQTALQTWGGEKVRGDQPAAGRVGFLELWQIFNGKTQRSKDTAKFLAENQRDFYSNTYSYLKKDLGFKSLVYGSNWQTAEPRILGPLDKWSNTVGDIMDRHGYYDIRHSGERASYSISKGDKYSDVSALRFDPAKPGDPPNFALPLFQIDYNNKPSSISEVNWTPPNAFRADFPIVSAAYGSLQGTDAIYFFATGAPWWEEMLGKFGIRTPVTFGQFPAAALIYRKELVKTAPVVVDVNLSMAKLWDLQGAPASAPANLDQLRQQDVPPGQAAKLPEVSGFDPLAYLVGRVNFNFVDGDKPSSMFNLTKYIDHKSKTARSATGELSWNHGSGLVKVDSPTAQGITGFLSRAGKVDLGALAVETGLEYGSVMAVALDGKPIGTSAKILLQVMSQEQNYGWQTSGTEQKEITNLGSAPMMVKHLTGTVALKRPDAAKLKLTALDFNGYPKQRLTAGATIKLLPDTIYYLIEK